MDKQYSDYLPCKLTGFFADKRDAMIESLKQLPEADGAVLEIGSGTGENLQFVPARTSIGLEPDVDMLALNKPGRIVRAVGECLPFADLTFIYSFTVTVLQHVRDVHVLSRLIAEACRVSRKAVYFFEDSIVLGVVRSLVPKEGWHLNDVENLYPAGPHGGMFGKITLIRSP